VVDLSTSHNDLQLAVVENTLRLVFTLRFSLRILKHLPNYFFSPGQIKDESVVRLYDVGRYRSNEAEFEDVDEDEDNANDDGNIFFPIFFFFFFFAIFVQEKYVMPLIFS